MALEPFPNLVTMFFARAGARGEAPFLWRKAGGRWQATSWAEAAAQVAALAAALPRLGLRRGDRVMLVAENRPEWCIADLGVMAAGGVTVPAYTTNTAADHAHVLNDSGATVAIVSTAKLARALAPALAGSGCRLLIAMEDGVTAPEGVALHAWEALVAEEADVAACAAAATFGPDDLACIIYTSGTGGLPRGVRHHHGAILHNVRTTRAIIEEDFDLAGREGVFLSLLPLSHAYEHSAGQHLPIGLGGQIYYAEGIERLAANIAEVRPEIMIVVPRLFELLRARILKQFEKEGRLARWLLVKALALRPGPVRWRDRPLDLLLSRTIRPRIAGRFGGRLMALVSGGAPLNPEVGGFFGALGLTLLQGYGQTEAGPVISCNRPRAGIDLTTVGPPLDEVELRIAEDGEILVRGPNVMHGYWQNEEETARALVAGWLHTGDVGEIDGAGRLRITDRKKDLIVNDKGDNVAPQRVEGLLTLQPEIGQAMVAGDRRPYLVGLVVPDAGWAAEWAQARGIGVGEAAADPAFRAALNAAVERVNAGLAPVEKVRRIMLADEPFGIENGEMTPSLKIRRHAIRARYGARLDALYGG